MCCSRCCCCSYSHGKNKLHGRWMVLLGKVCVQLCTSCSSLKNDEESGFHFFFWQVAGSPMVVNQMGTWGPLPAIFPMFYVLCSQKQAYSAWDLRAPPNWWYVLFIERVRSSKFVNPSCLTQGPGSSESVNHCCLLTVISGLGPGVHIHNPILTFIKKSF